MTTLEDPAVIEEDAASDEALFDARGHWKDKPSDWGNPEERLARAQFLGILQRCLDALPDRLARLFMLREVMEEVPKISVRKCQLSRPTCGRWAYGDKRCTPV